MGLKNTPDVREYLANNADEVYERINKMYKFGTLIFEGKIRQHNVNQVVLNDCWVLFVDPIKKNAVTIYKIDFGVGEEFNKAFIEAALNKIKIAKEEFKIVEEKHSNDIAIYKDIVNGNLEQIKELEATINMLKKYNEDVSEVIKSSEVEVELAIKNINDAIDNMVCRKVM